MGKVLRGYVLEFRDRGAVVLAADGTWQAPPSEEPGVTQVACYVMEGEEEWVDGGTEWEEAGMSGAAKTMRILVEQYRPPAPTVPFSLARKPR